MTSALRGGVSQIHSDMGRRGGYKFKSFADVIYRWSQPDSIAVVAVTDFFLRVLRDSRKSHEAMIGKEQSVISGARLEFCANAFCLGLEFV